MTSLKHAGSAVLVLMITACGGGGGSTTGGGTGSPDSSYTATSGVAQKGPLFKGSTVTAQELSAELAPTGKQYSFQTNSDLGTFTPNATFGSPYIGLSATGYYFDEVQGTVSTGNITLTGISDLSSAQVLNVNLLTTLAYQRIQTLVAAGQSVSVATVQAEKEVLAALHIPGGASYGSFGTLDLSQSGNGNKILEAVSSLFVEAADTAAVAGSSGNASGELASLIASFQSDIADNGVIDTAATNAALAHAAVALNPTAIAANLTQRYAAAAIAFSPTDISNWIDTSGSGVVGAFTFQPAAGAASSSFTFPSSVVNAVAGTVVTVSSGQLLVNGVAVSSASIQAGDTVAVSVGSVSTPQPGETVYLLSNGVNVADVALTPAYTGLSLLAGSIGGSGNLNGAGSAARFGQPEGIAVDNAGNMYVADQTNSTIRKITPAGVVTTLAGSGTIGSANGTGTTASFNYPTAVAVDGSGNIIVADTDNDLIRKVTPGGAVSTLAGTAGASGSTDGTGSAARFNRPSGVVVDTEGNIYIADSGNSNIRKLTSAGVVITLAGSGKSGSANGAGAAASFNAPSALAVDGSGNLIVADTGNNLIRKITPAGVVTTLAGMAGISGNADGSGATARFNAPGGVAVDSSGNILVGDTRNNTIRMITPSGTVTTLAGVAYALNYLTASYCHTADGTGSAAGFCYPSGIAVNGAGNVLVADALNGTIRKITPAGAVTTLAGLATALGSTDGSAATAQFAYPEGPAVDSSGNVFVADSYNNTIREITPGGTVTTIAGMAGQSGSTDGVGAAARFNGPRGVAVDGSGNLYVADGVNNTIRKITPAGVVSTLAGLAGVSGSADGTGSAAQFWSPGGVAVDRSGNVYVADDGNSTIRKISPTGVVTTLAGSNTGNVLFGNCQLIDGTGAAAAFCHPQGIAVDSSGMVYVADAANDAIRKITPAGVVSTLAGTPYPQDTCQAVDGTGSAARFCWPDGITIDAAGNLFVSDSSNDTIRKISPSGVVSTVVGVAGANGIVLSNLPASIAAPDGVALSPAGQLVIGSGNAVLITGTGGF